MAHYAEIINNVVERVIVADEAFIEHMPGTWIQTSYNTRLGVHYGEDGLPDGKPALRLNFAAPGMLYDPTLDAFIFPKPEDVKEELVLDPKTGAWKNPNGATCNGFSASRNIEPILDIDHLL